jgi:hypothetical protein
MIRLTPLRIIILAATVIALAVLLPGVRDFLAVDSCLDAGGVYDYAQGRCRYDVVRLPVPPAAALLRLPDTGSVVGALGVGAAMLAIFAMKDAWQRASRKPAV